MKDDEMIEAMERYGGSFVKALAQCLWSADANNYQRLEQAFPEYFKEYRKMSKKDEPR